MTKTELKQQLNRYRELTVEIRQLREEIDRVERVMLGAHGIQNDGQPHGTGISDPTYATASRHLALVSRYELMIVKLSEEQERIEALIDALEPRLRALMRYHYVDGLTWEEVCVRINYSWRHTHNLHSSALEKILETVADTSESRQSGENGDK